MVVTPDIPFVRGNVSSNDNEYAADSATAAVADPGEAPTADSATAAVADPGEAPAAVPDTPEVQTLNESAAEEASAVVDDTVEKIKSCLHQISKKEGELNILSKVHIKIFVNHFY